MFENKTIAFLQAVLLVVTCFLPGHLVAEDSIPVYVFSEQSGRAVILDAAVMFYPDPTKALLIEDMLGKDAPVFVSSDHASIRDTDYAMWFRIRVTNTTDRQISKLLTFPYLIREGRGYVVNANKIFSESRFGSRYPPEEKEVFSVFNYVQLAIPPGASRMIYVRADHGKGVIGCCASYVYAHDSRTVQQYVTKLGSICFLYLGIMIVIGLMGAFSFLLFRKSIFLYFGMLMVLFGLHCVFSFYQQALLFPNGQWLDYQVSYHLIGTGIFLSLFLFVTAYLDLSVVLPRYYRLYLGSTIIVLFVHIIYSIWPSLSRQLSHFEVTVDIIWVVLTFYPIIKLALAGQKSARVLVYSIFVLFLGALTFLSVQTGFFSDSLLARMSFYISTLFFAGIIFRELFVRFSDLLRQKNQLTETGLLKSRFFANITHEFRTPLTLMLGPLRQVIGQSKEPESVAMLRVAERNAERQLELVDQLLDLSRIDAKAMQLQAAPADLSAYLRRIMSAYDSLAVQQNITLNIQVPEAPVMVYFDEEKMDRILYNLLSNSFKFTPEGGEIKLALTRDAKMVEVEVSDTGRGIDAQLLPHIFDRFFLAGNEATDSKGSGIGLALVREMVHLHHGEVSVASQVGEGTTFTIRLPLGKAHLTPEEISPIPQDGARSANPTVARKQHPPRRAGTNSIQSPGAVDTSTNDTIQQEGKDALPTLLLVEDNAEMQAFISQLLTPHYRVTTANNGAEGVRLALKTPPDIVVSDLMMPEKDGYQVCRELKTDLRTSHVPIILLTARASQNARLAGLDEGADDYLTKPFDALELVARAANLIKSRRHLRERFASSITVQPNEIAVTSTDQAFLTSALQHIERYLAEPDLSVDHLAAALNVSRSQLNRKLRALVNMSSNQFIQSVRLQRAAQLLRDNAGTIKEIAYDCGFSTPTYFGSLFKAKFGMSPTQYLGGADEIDLIA